MYTPRKLRINTHNHLLTLTCSLHIDTSYFCPIYSRYLFFIVSYKCKKLVLFIPIQEFFLFHFYLFFMCNYLTHDALINSYIFLHHHTNYLYGLIGCLVSFMYTKTNTQCLENINQPPLLNECSTIL